MEYTVRLAGTERAVRVSGGTLAEACALLGHALELVCGGNGRCGKCDVLVERGDVREIVRACVTPVAEDITVFLEASEDAAAQILTTRGAHSAFAPVVTKTVLSPAELEPAHCGAYLTGASFAAARRYGGAPFRRRRGHRHNDRCDVYLRSHDRLAAAQRLGAQRPDPLRRGAVCKRHGGHRARPRRRDWTAKLPGGRARGVSAAARRVRRRGHDGRAARRTGGGRAPCGRSRHERRDRRRQCARRLSHLLHRLRPRARGRQHRVRHARRGGRDRPCGHHARRRASPPRPRRGRGKGALRLRHHRSDRRAPSLWSRGYDRAAPPARGIRRSAPG